jgi:hypothetical protein
MFRHELVFFWKRLLSTEYEMVLSYFGTESETGDGVALVVATAE